MLSIPVYNLVVVPNSTVIFPMDEFQKRTGQEASQYKQVAFLFCREEKVPEKWTEASFFPIGVTGFVTDLNSENNYVSIRTTARINIESVEMDEERRITITSSMRTDIEDVNENEERTRFEKIRAILSEYSSQFAWWPIMQNYVRQWNNLGEMATAMSGWLPNTPEDKYEVVAEDSRARRLELLEKIMYEYVESARVNTEAASAQDQENRKLYREQAIKKQLNFLQKELDEMHPENVSDVRKFEIGIEEVGMNETAEREARKVLNRLKQDGQNSTESGMLYDYLDFVTGLSWKKEDPVEIDLDEAEKILDEDHFGLKKVKQRIIQQIAVMNLQKKQSGSIILFVGAPGTGKTSIGQSIAKALHRKYVRVSLGGVRDEADIRGHRRTYIGAMPGRIMDGIHKSGVSNPVMVLDEVDKLSASYNGDPASALLEVLDPEQNDTFTDHYMNVPYDLSDVMFICTANSLDTIPEPLLNRMEVIQFPGYTATDKYQIARRHLLPKAMESMGIQPGQLVVEDDALRAIIFDYTMEAGVRGLKKHMDTICRTAAVRIVRDGMQASSAAGSAMGGSAAGAAPDGSGGDSPSNGFSVDSADGSGTGSPTNHSGVDSADGSGAGSRSNGFSVDSADGSGADSPTNSFSVDSEDGSGTGSPTDGSVTDSAGKSGTGSVVTVTTENIRDFLDMKPIRHEQILKEKQPGIVTGLAWTTAGGEILFIETLFTKGSGKTVITGQLGDVMKESVQIAVSLVKSMFPDRAELFEENDLHVHVPAGAVPKDGPSAGITLTTALASLVTGRPVSPAFAMTGEVSLRGVVTPIGGLPEKLMAAQRAGISTVFIPADNEDDLRDVADEVKKKLHIIPVTEVQEVLKRTEVLEEKPNLEAV